MIESERTYSLHLCDTGSTIRRKLKLLDASEKCLAQVVYHAAHAEEGEEHMKLETFESVPLQLISELTTKAGQLLPVPSEGIRCHHTFVLLDRRTWDVHKMGFPHNHPDEIKVHHELMEHLYGTLTWVPTWLVRGHDEPFEGFDLCGIVEVRQNGASKLISLMNAWADVLGQGPEELTLHSGVAIPWSDDGTEEGTWCNADAMPVLRRLDRQASVSSLREVAQLAEDLLKRDEHHYIIHGGI